MLLQAIFNKILKQLFLILPYSLQTILCRGNPDLAFFVRKIKSHTIINYYLSEFTLELDLIDDRERRLLSGTFEAELKAVLPRLVGKNDICLDIGANSGAISFALAKLVGKEGIVHSFESSPIQAKKLKRNLELNPKLLDRIVVYENSLSDGIIGNIGSLHGRIDFIRMNANGLELEFLEATASILKNHKPNILFEISLTTEEQRKTANQLENKLRSLGYDVLRVSRALDLLPTTSPYFSEKLVAMTRARIDELHYV